MHHGGHKKESVHSFFYVLVFVHVNSIGFEHSNLFIGHELENRFSLLHNSTQKT